MTYSHRIYLDSCCLNRPFDDQTQDRIHLESEAILTLLQRCQSSQMLKTQQQLINDGYQALLHSLGPVETIRFLQYFSPGKGDYTQERHNFPAPDLDTLLRQMQALPAPDPEQYDEII